MDDLDPKGIVWVLVRFLGPQFIPAFLPSSG